jgi:hypothetical protein
MFKLNFQTRDYPGVKIEERTNRKYTQLKNMRVEHKYKPDLIFAAICTDR